MKKLIAILAISLLAVTAVFAQQSDPAEPNAGRAVDVSQSGGDSGGSSSSGGGFLFGFKVGVGMSKFRAVDTLGYYEDQYTDPLGGWIIGAKIGYFFGMFGIMADVEYIRKGFSNSFGIYEEKLKLDYIDVNLMFAIRAGGFYAGIGIYFGLKIKSDYSLNGVSYGEVNGLKDTDFGGVLTLGFMFGGAMKFYVGLDIKIGLTAVYKSYYYDYKNVGLFLNFGMLFGG